ncbi:MAG: hypothetical protein Q8R29_02670, partial [bacterium]|nr:hypothetical protein [bacterium]
MSKFYKKNYLVVLLAFILFITGAVLASALSEADIVYPAKELNNCKDKNDCLKYCDDSANIKVCVDFAEKYDLMSKSDADQARRFIKAGSKGPGGCNSKDSCESYCNDVGRINECLSFAEKNGLMDPDELAEAKKIQQALDKGAKLPGGCSNKNACENYCQTADHIEECVAFAEAAGFMPPEELEEAKKYMAALKSGIKPLPCRGKAECEDYCQEPGNFKNCIEFAEAAGFISSEEA